MSGSLLSCAQELSSRSSVCAVLQLEAELMLNGGDLDAALLLSERAVSLADKDDSVPLVCQGNVKLQKVGSSLDSLSMQGHSHVHRHLARFVR